MKKVVAMASSGIIEWVEDQKTSMDEKQYLKFLCGFEKWLKEY